MPTKKVKGGWKYGNSATFKKKPSKAQKAAIEISKKKRNKK
jgi:hypothetical protein